MNINTKLVIALEKLRVIKMQRTSAIAVVKVLSEFQCHSKKQFG